MDIEISKEDADYMYSLVQQIVDEIGPRMSCSSQEADGANVHLGHRHTGRVHRFQGR